VPPARWPVGTFKLTAHPQLPLIAKSRRSSEGTLESEARFPYKESPAMTSSHRPVKPSVALPYMEITSCAHSKLLKRFSGKTGHRGFIKLFVIRLNVFL